MKDGKGELSGKAAGEERLGRGLSVKSYRCKLYPCDKSYPTGPVPLAVSTRQTGGVVEFCHQTIVEQLHVDGRPSDLQEGIDQLVRNLDKDIANLLLLIDHATNR